MDRREKASWEESPACAKALRPAACEDWPVQAGLMGSPHWPGRQGCFYLELRGAEQAGSGWDEGGFLNLSDLFLPFRHSSLGRGFCHCPP